MREQSQTKTMQLYLSDNITVLQIKRIGFIGYLKANDFFSHFVLNWRTTTVTLNEWQSWRKIYRNKYHLIKRRFKVGRCLSEESVQVTTFNAIQQLPCFSQFLITKACVNFESFGISFDATGRCVKLFGAKPFNSCKNIVTKVQECTADRKSVV